MKYSAFFYGIERASDLPFVSGGKPGIRVRSIPDRRSIVRTVYFAVKERQNIHIVHGAFSPFLAAGVCNGMRELLFFFKKRKVFSGLSDSHSIDICALCAPYRNKGQERDRASLGAYRTYHAPACVHQPFYGRIGRRRTAEPLSVFPSVNNRCRLLHCCRKSAPGRRTDRHTDLFCRVSRTVFFTKQPFAFRNSRNYRSGIQSGRNCSCGIKDDKTSPMGSLITIFAFLSACVGALLIRTRLFPRK